MRKYIILAYNITGMGGGQQYVYNKVKYLTANGFDTVVYSAIKGEMVIHDFCRFNTLIVPALKYPPACFRTAYQNEILEILAQGCEKTDDVWIESTGAYETQWAELLAEKVQGKHVCFALSEQQNKCYSKNELAFLYFKYQRRELYGIAQESLRLIFRNVHEIPDSAECCFVANCINVVDKTMEYAGPALPEVDYRIGCIWRTNKEGFLKTIDNLIPFIKANPQNTFGVVVIGGGSCSNEERAAKLLAAYPNVKTLFLGYTYPIPLDLLRRMDVFVSSAGSANVTAMHNLPTISVTTKISEGREEFCPLGILNYTTVQTVVPVESELTLSDYLRMILFEHYCTTHVTLGKEWPDDTGFIDEYKREISFFETKVEKKYFPVNSIRPQGYREKGYKALGRIAGCGILSFVDMCLHKIKSFRC